MSADEDGSTHGFAGAKRTILLHLKQSGSTSLAELARTAGISKTAALGHLALLESQGWIERSFRRGAVGRPPVCFQLSPRSTQLFPQSYSEVSRAALDFIERRLGRPAVVELLQERAHDLADRNRSRVSAHRLSERVERLATVRSEGGYMAEVGTRRQGAVELMEHNCPVLALVGRYPEACDIERRMFESVLRAQVGVSHRIVAGDAVCRFWIREREGRG
ncbi:MAG: helix-turn-helix transcriptional regulator [Thermoplasmata archaeon]